MAVKSVLYVQRSGQEAKKMALHPAQAKANQIRAQMDSLQKDTGLDYDDYMAQYGQLEIKYRRALSALWRSHGKLLR